MSSPVQKIIDSLKGFFDSNNDEKNNVSPQIEEITERKVDAAFRSCPHCKTTMKVSESLVCLECGTEYKRDKND